MTHQFYGNQHTVARKFFKRSLWAAIIIIVAFLGAVAYQKLNPIIVTNTVEVIKDTSTVMFAEKIDSLEKSVVEQVRKCESAGATESTGLIVFDSNKVASIGTLQFQVKTVIYYYKALYGKVITGKEAILIALDDEKAGDLAQDIMFKSKNMADDWLNCSNKLSLSSQIQAIKKIK